MLSCAGANAYHADRIGWHNIYYVSCLEFKRIVLNQRENEKKKIKRINEMHKKREKKIIFANWDKIGEKADKNENSL